MSDTASRVAFARRWERFWWRVHARLDGEAADRIIPWAAAAVVFTAHLAIAAATVRSGNAGSGLGPWLQAAWARRGNSVAMPVGEVDPAQATGSVVGELVLQATRIVPATVAFTVVQSLAIAGAVVPLWRLARDRACLRVGASSAVIAAYALAPTLHRAGLSPFHPELVALPLLLVAWLSASRSQWPIYWMAVVAVLACRADLGLTVAAMGLLVASQLHRVHGLATSATGVLWSVGAHLWLQPDAPVDHLTPAGEFVARATGPLAAIPRLLTHPGRELAGLLSEPAIQFLVIVLAPLLFLPLVSFRRVAPAIPALALAIIADRAVAASAGRGVLTLSPAAAHITPALAFVFIAVVFALERIGDLSVVRVNVDRRLVAALVIGTTMFFLVESPSTPYNQPWDWGGRGREAQVRDELAALIPAGAAVASSPSATALVAERSTLVELPPSPIDLTPRRVATDAQPVDWVLLDTSALDPVSDEPVWRSGDVSAVVARFGDLGFEVVRQRHGVYLLARSSRAL